MKMKSSTNRKLRYGSTSVALTALIIAVTIAVNFIFSFVVSRYSLYIDLTPEPHFTLTDEFYALMEGNGDGTAPIEKINQFRNENAAYNAANGLVAGAEGARDENVCINLLFCVEPDILESTEQSNYVYQNAKDLAAKYPEYVTIEYKDMRKNPGRFTKYLSSNTETISNESIIIECGSEARVRSFESFYVVNEEGTATGYNGEKTFASSILAVTRAENPLACYTINHGESFPKGSTLDANGNPTVPFLDTLEAAGFETKAIDLSKEDIPENCRILVIYDPRQDFLVADGVSNVDELGKLDTYLASKKTLMVFMNPTSYTGEKGLSNLEDFLEEWGLAFGRYEGEPWRVSDTEASIGNSQAIVGTYGQNEAADAWSEAMRSGEYDPLVMFPNSSALTAPPSYTPMNEIDSAGNSYTTLYNKGASSNGSFRKVYDLFVTSPTAKAYAGEQTMSVAAATKSNPLRLMSLSLEFEYEQEYTTAIQHSAYVILCGSTDFGSEECLVSNSYGNSDFLLSVFRMAGKEPVPVGLKYKQMADYTIDTITSSEATQYTVVLTLVPVVVSLFAGVFVIIRRKNR